MKNLKPILSICLSFFIANANAEGLSKYYFGGGVGSALTKLKPTTDTVGAPGYVASCCSTGKMGDLNTASDTPLWDLKIGYLFSKELRFDLSYTQVQFGTTTWGTDFGSSGNWPVYRPASATKFSGGASSRLLLVNGYYSFINHQLFSNVTPYVGVGVGSSWNKFHQANEGGYNTVWGNTKTSFAYKFDVGVDYIYDKNLTFDLSARFIDLGSFSSKNSRGTNNEAISPYKFHSGVLPSLTVGVRYNY